MHLLKTACALLLLLAAGTIARAQDDPLKSPACAAALSSLQEARQARADAKRVEALRAEAASTCLGKSAAPARPGRVVQAPVAVPPPQIEPAPRAAPLPALPAPPPPVTVTRPPTPLTCDGGGCWVDDGTHLRQLPPNLAGPRGQCTAHAGMVYCP